ncbi:MAG: hypothetical protein MUP82_01905 [Candidatus Marinimicrobia bacterium]|nr:hypothetical protein [Candidatus Neomarinimicrobiota bacterium]
MDNTPSDEFSNWDVEMIVDFIKNNIVSLLLILLVFIIIYAVDVISNINAVLYAIPLASAITSQQNTNKVKHRKKSKQ